MPTACINSLAPGKFEWNFIHVIFKQTLVIDGWGISCKIALTWKPQDLTDDKSSLVQLMAWYRQATSHYLNQSWPSSLSPYGVTRPQWVYETITRFIVRCRHISKFWNLGLTLSGRSEFSLRDVFLLICYQRTSEFSKKICFLHLITHICWGSIY